MKKILDTYEPTIRTYLGDAFCFSIIDKYAFETGWIYDKYMHIEYTPFDGHIKYKGYDYYDFVPDEGVFIKSYVECCYDCCDEKTFCNIVVEMLENNEYCFALWNETEVTNYLFGRNDYNQYEHGCLIYGYDDEKKLFYSQGYINNEKWEQFTVPFSVLYKAIMYCREKNVVAFIGYKVRKDYAWKANDDLIKKEVTTYFIDVAKDSSSDIEAAYSFFSNLNSGEYIHYPSLYCMYEHKKLFLKRLSYIRFDSSKLSEYKAIVSYYKKIMLLGMQFNKNRDYSIFTSMLELAKKSIEMEKQFAKALNFF